MTVLHLKSYANHEISISHDEENSIFIVKDFSLVTSNATTEKFDHLKEAFTLFNELCTALYEEA